jgi:Zn-dependent protease with chaperone function
MFYGLAIVLCLAVLFIVLAVTSLVCAAGLRISRRLLESFSPDAKANWLFALRVLPLVLALLITIAFALPAFLRFEPHSTREMIGLRLLLLAGLGGAATASILLRALLVLWSTRRAEREWRRNSHPLTIGGLHVHRIDSPGPLLAVTGIFRPRIFIARSVAEHLSHTELAAAIAHEMAHVSALDNLKQLILKITRLPRWLNLFHNSDAAWVNASEMAADEGALLNGACSLELSSALVKVGRLSHRLPFNSRIAASHLLPVAAESCIEMRVTHLRKLLESDSQPHAKPAHAKRFWAFSFLALSLAYLLCLNAVLPWVHDILELLVH